MDQAAEFAACLPAWTGGDGLPMSWQHFVYGMAYLGRAANRRLLEVSSATRGGAATEESYASWQNKIELRA
jgi:hypothetical protein